VKETQLTKNEKIEREQTVVQEEQLPVGMCVQSPEHNIVHPAKYSKQNNHTNVSDFRYRFVLFKYPTQVTFNICR
jgi:hypothetical protein